MEGSYNALLQDVVSSVRCCQAELDALVAAQVTVCAKGEAGEGVLGGRDHDAA